MTWRNAGRRSAGSRVSESVRVANVFAFSLYDFISTFVNPCIEPCLVAWYLGPRGGDPERRLVWLRIQFLSAPGAGVQTIVGRMLAPSTIDSV